MYQECILYVSWMCHVCIMIIMDVSWWMYQCITWRLPPPCALPQHWPAPPSASQELLPKHLKKNGGGIEYLSHVTDLFAILDVSWMYQECIMLPICLLYWPVSLYSILSMASYLPRTCNKKAMSDKKLLQKVFWKNVLRDRALTDHGCLGELETKFVNLVFKTTLTFSFLTKRIPVTKKWQRF